MKKKHLLQVLVLIALISTAGCDRQRASVEKPKETITLEQATEMYQSYQGRFRALAEYRGGREDASYGWHSLDFYKNYIAYLEDAARKVNMEVSGLRLYYVAYPDNERGGDYRDYQTYMFVPTYYDEKTKKHIAFDPLHVDENGKPLPIHDIITGGAGKQVGQLSKVLTGNFRTVAATPSSVANMAQMCKPNCQ